MNVQFLVLFHLLATAVLAGLTLLLSIRFPYPETILWFRLALALVGVTGVAVLPLLTGSYGLLWLAPGSFVAATAVFLVFAIQVARAHYRRLRDRRPLR